MARPPRSRSRYPDIEGDYEVHETLGSGGFAKVKSGVHKATGEKVAIKIMDKVLLAHDLPRAVREIRVLKRLHHQHICQLYEVIETDKMFYLILEFCPGGELFDYIVAREKLKEKEARSFFRQIVAALKYVHEMGLCHRDLKPENLLLDDAGNIKLIDFGLCAEPAKITDFMETSCGSPAYAAPELIKGLPYLGPKADVWSLGVLLYALLNGFLPFDDEHTAYLYELIKKGKYEIPEWLSRGSIDIIGQLLQTNPDNRPSLEDLLSHPWLLNESKKAVDWKSRIDVVHLDQNVVQAMCEFYGKSAKDMIKEINQWKYDSVTCNYLLLLHKKLRGDVPCFKIAKQRRHDHHVIHTNSPPESPLTRRPHSLTPSNGTTDNSHASEDDEPLMIPKNQPRKLSIGTTVGPVPPGELTNLEKLVHPQVRKILSVESGNERVTEADDLNHSLPPLFLQFHQPVKQTVSYDDQLHRIVEESESDTNYPSWKPPSTPQPTKKSFFSKLKGKIKTGKAEAGPKEVKGHFTTSTTSVKSPDIVLDSLMRTLTKMHINFSRKDYKLKCQATTARGTVEFELEICQIRPLDIRGVRRKRLKGDIWVYKNVCDEIMKTANL